MAGLDLTKYSPKTCATSGEAARYRDTAAPCFEFSINGFTTAMISLPLRLALQKRIGLRTRPTFRVEAAKVTA